MALILFFWVGAMPAAAVAAEASLEVIGAGEDEIARRGIDCVVDPFHEFIRH